MSEQMEVEEGNTIVKERKPLSSNAKRRLRRERLAAALAGVEVPYNPTHQPSASDGPKLSNHAKRMARKRKKFEEDCKTFGEDEMRARQKAEAKDKRKKERKKNKLSKVITTRLEIKVEKSKAANEPGHLRFSDEEESGDTAVKESKNVVKDVKAVKVGKLNDEVNNICTSELNDERKGIEEKGKSNLQKQDKPAKKRRFVLFVGNLPYDATAEDIKVHFFKVGTILDIRMARHFEEEKKNQCRGFCYIELKDEETYLKALSMNHSFLGKRRINVEYSTGQTKEKKAEQKKKKAMMKSGDMHEIMNPAGGMSKAKRRTAVKRDAQTKANKFWV